MNKKFLILLTFTFCMIFSSNTFAFSDISGHWAEDEINKANRINIINGYSDNTFKPDAYMTRAELATLISKLFNIQTESDKYIPDVTRQDWFSSSVRKVVAMGIMQGDEKGYIRPNSYVTREEAILVISRAFNIIPSNDIIYVNYSDTENISEWARKEVLTFVKKKYINGYIDNTLKPQNNISRAEILTIIGRVAENDISTVLYSTTFNGNVLVRDTNVQLMNVEIYGNLIIGETSANIIKLNNVTINGNLVLYAPLSETENIYVVNGEVVKLYENKIGANNHYLNEEYGIKFSIPDGAIVVDSGDDKTDYKLNDLIKIETKQNEDYYLKTVNDIAIQELDAMNYDSIFKKVEEGTVGLYPYVLYKDNINSNLLIIKRDNVVYKMLFLNVVSENIIDSVLLNIEFISGTQIVNHDIVEYNNSDLCLAFSYRNGYVGIDDSYNTGITYSGDAFFKLFIQVNKITDIGDYSKSEVKMLLKSLVQNDGKILNIEEMKIAGHDAIQFEVQSENDKIISLYVIIGNNLYNFIFKGGNNEVDILGKGIFKEIVSSMEF